MTDAALYALEARWSCETDRKLQPARADVLALVAAVRMVKSGLAIQARLADAPPNDDAEVGRLRSYVEGLTSQ